MDIRKVVLGAIGILLLASFMPDIITSFNTAENTTGASTSLSTGLNIAQIALGIAAAVIVLNLAGIDITGGLAGGGGRRKK